MFRAGSIIITSAWGNSENCWLRGRKKLRILRKTLVFFKTSSRRFEFTLRVITRWRIESQSQLSKWFPASKILVSVTSVRICVSSAFSLNLSSNAWYPAYVLLKVWGHVLACFQLAFLNTHFRWLNLWRSIPCATDSNSWSTTDGICRSCELRKSAEAMKSFDMDFFVHIVIRKVECIV